ncbi:MAG: T9SS type A sorting domain-containing protein [Saprospiraceae bacterium]
MKTLLTIFICLFFISIPDSYSQITIKEGRQWNIVHWNAFTNDTRTELYKVEGDVFFGNLRYKQVWKTYGNDTLDFRRTQTFLREDSLSRVYEKFGQNPEHLLYDFSLEVGDTFTVFGLGAFGCNFEVSSIDSVQLLNGNMAKRLNLVHTENYFEDGYLIEGVGSSFGLTDPQGGCIVDAAFYLVCLYENGNQIFGDPSRGPCYQNMVPTKEISSEDQIKIFPNPFGQTIYIDISESSQSYNSIELLNARGRKVYQINEPGASIQINTGNLPNGFYILKMVTESGMVLTKRLVKS